MEISGENIKGGTKSVMINLVKILLLILNIGLYLIPATQAFETNQSANVVIGQNTMIDDMPNQGTTLNAHTLNNPQGIAVNGSKVFISDSGNRRTLVFNSIPQANNIDADVVVGQTDMNSSAAALTSAGCSDPTGVASINDYIFIVDWQYNRVLIYDTIPFQNGAPAQYVVGQADMTSSVWSCSPNNYRNSIQVFSEGTHLFVNDQHNHRILIYNVIPTTNNATADIVVGQPNMTSHDFNQGSGVAANTLYFPGGMCTYDNKFIIADSTNNRVLIFNSIPVADNTSADIVIGQSDMISNSPNKGGSAPAANSLNGPGDVCCDGTRLYIADTGNNRILIYNQLPTVANASADIVIGQTDMTGSSSGCSDKKFNGPNAICVENKKLFVTDRYNNRVLIFDDAPKVMINAPDHGIGGRTLAMTLYGSNLAQVTGVSLVKGGQVITGSNLDVINENQLTCAFNLPSGTGEYGIMLMMGAEQFNFGKRFTLLQSTVQPVTWRSSTLGSTGIPSLAGAYWAITVSDNDNNGKNAVLVADRNTQLSTFNWISNGWEKTSIPSSPTSSYLATVLVADMDGNNVPEIYATALNGNYDLIQFKAIGSSGTVIAHGSDKYYAMVYGDADNDGVNELYCAGEDGQIHQISYGAPWQDQIIANDGSRIVDLAIGSARGGQYFALYSANTANPPDAAGQIHEYQKVGASWTMSVVGSGTGEMTAVSIGDGNHDQQIEIYGANKDGKLYQYKWMTSNWETSTVVDGGEPLNDVLVNDGDNDGSDEVYVATNSGKVLQLRRVGSQWDQQEIGAVGQLLRRLAIGDGNNNHQYEVYAIGDDHQVYQFAAHPQTPTPLPTPTAIADFKGKLISEHYVYTAPNPVRGSNANFTVYTQAACSLEVQVFTSTHGKVMTFNLDCPGAGLYHKQVYMGNLANGVYLFLVKADNGQGTKERLVKKIALIK